jgi:hypothetical protein
MTPRTLCSIAISAITLAVFAGTPAAQLSGIDYMEGSVDWVSDQMWHDMIVKQPIENDIKRKQGLARQQGGAGGGGTTTFRPGRRAVLEQMPPQQRAQAPQILAACDQLYSRTMSSAGIRSAAELNDVATSTAFMVAMAHHVYWDGQPGAPAEAQPAHMQFLSSRLRQSLVNRGRFVGKSDQQKQLAHDSLILSACIPVIQYSKAKKTGNEQAKQALRVQAANLLGKIGLGPTSLQFNPDGTVLVTPTRRSAQRQGPGGG